MEFLLDGISMLSWKQIVMYGVGILLIWLAIKKDYEPSLLLPMGFGAILVNLPQSGVIDQLISGVGESKGIIQWLFETGIDVSEAMPILLFIGIGAMIDFGPLLANPSLFLFGAGAQFGIFAALLLAVLLGFDLKNAASIAVIGAADGPTSIMVSQILKSDYIGAIAVACTLQMSAILRRTDTMTHEEILAMLGDYVDYLIANSSAEAPMWNIEKVRSGKPNKWNYIDGCMITACLSLYKTTGDEKYLNFSKNFIDYFVQEDGSIKTYDPKEYNLDNVNQGKNLFTLYDIFGDEKYRKAIETIRSQLATQPRTKEGNFWHKDIYPWQVWLDGTYMAQPFYMEYETRFNKMQGCIDSYKQFMNIKKHMRDEKTGLYYHGYDESRQMYWADPVTGCSPNFWLRAMGWFMVAMVDVLERMDEQLYNEYRGIMAMLKQTIEDVHKFQDEETGMFWQVMDHPGVEGNYLETSGTALFAYAVLKGVRLGYLPKRMAAWAEKAFYGTCDKYLSKNPDGSLQLDGICLVAGLGGKDHRDGSLAYYFSEPVVCNDAKGVGPLVLAYTEMIARK